MEILRTGVYVHLGWANFSTTGVGTGFHLSQLTTHACPFSYYYSIFFCTLLVSAP